MTGSRSSHVQAKLFLQAFHQSRINQSAKLVEDEQWSQTEVSSAVQHAADVLVDSAVRDSPDLVIRGEPLSAAPPSHSTDGKATSTPNKHNGSIAPTAKYIHIEERPYFCVSATGAVLGLLLEYLKLVVNLPMLNTDTMSRVIEFLKAFNSRTCQVVLGAGAMRSAGLKNITAKHLGWYLFLLFAVRANFIDWSSPCLPVTLHYGGAHSVRAGNVPTPSQPKPGSHAC